jgi:hypothetical protein
VEEAEDAGAGAGADGGNLGVGAAELRDGALMLGA